MRLLFSGEFVTTLAAFADSDGFISDVDGANDYCFGIA